MQSFVIFLLLFLFVMAAGSAPAPLIASRQLVVVTTADWDAVSGVLRRFERQRTNVAWREAGEPIPIVVGRNGLAWGRGLQGDAPLPGVLGPIKKEGDGRSPAGVFRLRSAFGYAKTSGLKLPYVQAVPTLECVDDVKSAHYNRVLDRRAVAKPDWTSSEQMRRSDDQYRLGVVVDHNAAREAGCGSCIFLHIWAGAGKGTAGCTAMDAEKMEALMRWLDAKKQPVLVQLPRAAFGRLQTTWNLPK